MTQQKTKIPQTSTLPPSQSDPVTHYANEVLAGRIVAGPLVRLACKRHLDDLSTGQECGLSWHPELARRAIQFFPDVLKLAEGEHAGKPFYLELWQQFVVGSLFGWLGADGYRRFRTAYVEVGKGNGKSPMAGGIGLYMLSADGEAGAECYAAAVTRDQAGILFQDAVKMVDASAGLSRRIHKSGKSRVFNLAHLASGSYFRPVSSEGRGLDGKRVHFAALDEIHEHPTPIVVDKMRAGTKGRRQAMVFEITNSGFDRESVCFKHHEYSRQILEGHRQNDTWFAYVCQLDYCADCGAQPKPGCEKCDDWRDERNWIKVNPNLGVSVTHKYLAEQVKEACDMPSKENIVKRLNFCIWTEQSTRAIPMEKWDACDGAVEIEHGEPCCAGLDMASRRNKCALVLAFPPRNGKPWRLLPYYWVPEGQVIEREKKGDTTYRGWVNGGFLRTTPGDITDYDRVRADIKEIASKYNIVELPKDPWNSTQIGTQLKDSDGLNVTDFDQRMNYYTAPTKELLDAIVSGNLAHAGHPILRADAANLATMQDSNGNLKPDRDKSGGDIDGIAGALMGMGRAMVNVESGDSVYESRGVLTI